MQGGWKPEQPPRTTPKEMDTAAEADDMSHTCECVQFPVTEPIYKRKKWKEK